MCRTAGTEYGFDRQWLIVGVDDTDAIGVRLHGWVGHDADLKKLNPEAVPFVPRRLQELSDSRPRHVERGLPPPQPRISIESTAQPEDLAMQAPPVSFFSADDGDASSDMSFASTLPGLTMHVPGVEIRLPDMSDMVPTLESDYVAHFRQLLGFEERQMAQDMRLYRVYSGALERDEGSGYIYHLHVPGLQEWRPPTTYGDLVRLRTEANPTVAYEGYVYNVDRRAEKLWVSLLLPHEVATALDTVRFNVDFVANRIPLFAMRRALRLLSTQPTASVVEAVTLRAAIAQDAPASSLSSSPSASASASAVSTPRGAPRPFRALTLADHALTDRDLNWEQRDAVQTALAQATATREGRPEAHGRMAIVFGPPGTGKTRTVVEITLQLLARLRLHHPEPEPGSLAPPAILITAPSNQAVDILVARLSEHVEPADMLRLNAYSRTFAEVPANIARYSYVSRDNTFFDLPPLLRLLSYRIVAVTSATAGLLLASLVPRGHFAHILIDESGQAMEPELLIPLTMADARTTVVLAGDHCQLGPSIRSPVAIRLGLGKSLQERLMTTLEDTEDCPEHFNVELRSIMLRRNYRSHPSMLFLASRFFYHNQLIATANHAVTHTVLGWSELPNPNFPIMFVGVDGPDKRENDSSSFYNLTEIDRVVSLVESLLAERGAQGIRPADISVISPFRTQVKKLRLLLRDHGLSNVSVGTVEDYQGQENKCVIISTVRSRHRWINFDERYNLGLVHNRKRFNVAVTRAQALLVVVGNPQVLAADPYWAAFLRLCFRHGAYRGCQFPVQLEARALLASDKSSMEMAYERGDAMTNTPSSRWLGAAVREEPSATALDDLHPGLDEDTLDQLRLLDMEFDSIQPELDDAAAATVEPELGTAEDDPDELLQEAVDTGLGRGRNHGTDDIDWRVSL